MHRDSDSYIPDYHRILHVIAREKVDYIPLYEHNASIQVIEKIIGKEIGGLLDGDYSDKVEYFKQLTKFYQHLGYDCIPYSGSILPLVQNGEGLMGCAGAIISTEKDIHDFPWDNVVDAYFELYRPNFCALGESLPPGMKAIGGIGYGIFETVQDFVPFTELAYLEIDNPQVFCSLWNHVGTLFINIWTRLLHRFGDVFAVCRIGDDMGFKTSLLIKPSTFHEFVMPQYKTMVDLIHRFGKPFLLHSCGKIWDIMDELIDEVGIDAKHSNEDEIAPFETWVDRYSHRIALFGGVDMNILCLCKEYEIKELTLLSFLTAIIIAVFSGMNVMDAILGPYMTGVAAFLKSWFVIFLLGALFGKIYADVGAAKVLGVKFAALAKKFPGHEKIIGLWAVCIIAFILIFGGVNSFVILFVMMPITKNIFEQLDIPWEFYGCSWLGSSVLATGTAPGSPSLQNIIPMNYLGTTPMAGAMMGLITSIVAIIGGHFYMLYIIKDRDKKGQGFLPSGAAIAASMAGEAEEDAPDIPLIVCLIPSVVLVVGLNVFGLSPELSMVIALVLSLILFRKQLTDIKQSFVIGTSNAITAIVLTAALAGIGTMVAATPGYSLIISALNSIPGPPEIQVLIGIAVATGITSSGTLPEPGRKPWFDPQNCVYYQ